MITKADLRKYWAIDEEMRQLERILQTLRTRMSGPRVAVIEHTPRGKSGTHDPMADYAGKMDELTRLYNKLWDELIDLNIAIEKGIEGLDPLERYAIRLRYFERLGWVGVAAKIGCSDRQAARVIDTAIAKLGREENVG